MIVYVESNFVLEIVLEQEESAEAERIIAIAEHGEIKLAIPAFSLIEPYWTLKERGKERKFTCSNLLSQLNQLKRSKTHQGFVDVLTPMIDSMLERDCLKKILQKKSSLTQQMISRIERREFYPNYRNLLKITQLSQLTKQENYAALRCSLPLIKLGNLAMKLVSI